MLTEVVLHEADEPDAIVDFLDSHCLPGQTSAEIDLLSIKAKTSAVSDDNSLVMERVVRLADTVVGPGRRRIDFSWGSSCPAPHAAVRD